MEINAAQRKLEICKLSEFLSSAKNQVDSLVSSLGWTTDNLKKSEIKYNCPYNPGHVICSKTANEHISKCYLKSQGYKLDEAFLCEPKIESNNSVKIDHALKIQILNHTRSTQHDFKQVWNGLNSEPMTSSRLTSTFSADERLALYNYCIAHTVKPKVPEDLPLFSESGITDKNLSYEEIEALKRDSKRRRIKYRAVHTNKKSYNEVMKEVIENQMEVFEDWLTCRNKGKKRVPDPSNASKGSLDDVERPQSSTSKHSGTSSRHSKKHEHREHRNDGYERDKSRDRHRRKHREHRDSSDKRHRLREYSEEKRHKSGRSIHEERRDYRRSRSDRRH
ncbi:unnamed protein product [Brassicogethes aeneus]|uniref:CHHC U11-48K-type domain-containing protein n=1 Tax=Brassicogethes aeneus TaxID=1431903 RepID=A0A9P0FF07_BRAAE|nr:unnamed protein product [Brassicogethes aeneus]